MLVILANPLVAGLITGGVSAAELQSTFYLAFFIHVGFSLYDGSFEGRRTVTWLLLIVAWFGAELATFLGYIFPWGHISFWLATRITAILPSAFAEKFYVLFGGSFQSDLSSVVWPSILLLLLAADLALMHRESWRSRTLIQLGMFLATAVAAALLLGFVTAALVGHSTTGVPDSGAYPRPAHILPAWNALPFYALLRAIPNKLAGVALVFAAMAVPLIWPWMRADDLRVGPVRKVWLLLCLTQAAVWICLGYLGSLPPKPPEIYIAQALAVAYLAFFLVWPPLLHQVARQR